MNSKLFRLNFQDFLRGAGGAIITAVITVIYNLTQTPGFDISSLDWGVVLNAALYGFIGYIGVAAGSDENGRLGGMI